MATTCLRFPGAMPMRSFRSDASNARHARRCIPPRLRPLTVVADLLVHPDDGEVGDERYFLNNRTRYYRWRYPTDIEIQFKRLPSDHATGRDIGVLVKMIGERCRLRIFFWSGPFKRPWQHDDNVCDALFTALSRRDPKIGETVERLLAEQVGQPVKDAI